VSVIEFASPCIKDFFQAQQYRRLAQKVISALKQHQLRNESFLQIIFTYLKKTFQFTQMKYGKACAMKRKPSHNKWAVGSDGVCGAGLNL
jgi:hypothetical protein